MAIGFRICRRERAVPRSVVSRFAGIPVANMSDCMARLPAAGPTVRPMHNGAPLLGVAFTVKTRPGDNLMVHKALDMAGTGDVVVVDAGGDLSNAIVGELMVTHAQRREIAGLVIHGAVRDSDTLRQGAFPVFASGVTHRGPYKNGPGEINVPIAIAGMVIEPGDLIAGDGDGVICVPYDEADQVLTDASAKQNAETQQMSAITSGTSDRSWVDRMLVELGCEISER